MCDYSLMHVASRPAKVGEKIQTGTFNNSSSAGFKALDTEVDTAVCVLPGTEIGFDSPIETGRHGQGEGISEFSVGVFRQVNKEQQHQHHDALELPDGRIVMLNNLKVGQRATILQLPAAPKTEQEATEQERLEVVA